MKVSFLNKIIVIIIHVHHCFSTFALKLLQMKVLSSALRVARHHISRDWELVDSKLISSVRPHGIGLCPILTTMHSPSKRRRALSVHAEYSVPKDCPLAVIPFGCAIGAHSWLDTDRTYLLPSVDDLRNCLGKCGHEELVDVVGIALSLCFHLVQLQPSLRCTWFAAMLQSISTVNAVLQDDNEILSATIREIHTVLATSMIVPHIDAFEVSVKYSLGSLVELESPKDAATSDESNDEPAVCFAVVPVLDAVVNKYSVPANVALHKLSRDSIRALRRDGFPLIGCGQSLISADAKTDYLVLVSLDDIRGGEELSLNQSFPVGRPDLWSSLERLRLGVS
ncbi:Hypothetical protein, putative [Bodo saltans]|uniref:Uncharacterized protein n=1 Tax=Bodo saltans TaxID=75058 RepID=A0A0S4IIL7_BODSA|nr:Hypothetical protein, putative [Bodo saltans]|eukprot:CUE72380.1 Hypothetical protein, putative [Bodo saltans]